MKFFLIGFLFIFISINLYSQENYFTPEQLRILFSVKGKVTFDGEAFGSRFNPPFYIKSRESLPNESDAYSSITFTQMSSLRNYYDLQSNGSAVQIWQDPTTPNNIHAVYMYSNEQTGWSDRTIQYFFSSDKGTTWSFTANIPGGSRAGFGTITGTSNGCALIAAHTNQTGSANSTIRTQIYIDAFPGLGSFTRLDPGSPEDSKYIWPRIIATQNTSLPVKYVFTTSTSTTSYDSAFWNAGTSLSASTFSNYKPINGNTAETYAISRGADGRIGVVYIAGDNPVTTDQGDLYFMESTNNGTSFGTPSKIHNANFATDSMGVLRGVSIVYKSNTPCVVFETIKMDGMGGYFPETPAVLRFWSPAINSGNSLVIADKNNTPFAPPVGNTDVELSICRPSIGISGDGNMLFCSMMVQSSTRGNDIDSTSYNDIYLARSSNGGANWVTPERITPVSPRNDWTYANISPYNDYNANNYYVNIVMQRDTIPGSNTNASDTRTNAKPFFVRVAYARSVAPPAVPNLLTPANNATNQLLTPTLTWSSTGITYRVQVSTTAGFTNVIVDQSGITTESYQIPAPLLTQSTTYYWHVNATNDLGTSAYSSTFNFTTTSATVPIAPTLATPANNATGVSTTPAFDWLDVSGAASYRMQLSYSSSFTTVIYDTAGIIPSQFTMPLTLANATTFYWRVSASNIAGTGQYSSVFNFTTIASAPSAPVLVSPANGAIGITLTPTMVWQSSGGATGYNIQIATDVNFNNVVFSSTPTGTTQAIPSGVLQLNTLYFWRVRAGNGAGYGGYSSPWNFRSTTVNVNTIAGIIPTEFKLYGNYPNPFNPSTTIRFDIPKHSDVMIKVFDMTGRQVSELINLSVDAGAYETKFDASKLASGIYYYNIIAGDFSDTKKMILVK